MYYNLLIILLLSLGFSSCQGADPGTHSDSEAAKAEMTVAPGAHDLPAYLPSLSGKRIGLVVNHTSTIGPVHLVDTLMRLGVEIDKIYAPEHGFRGHADAGAHIEDGVDPETGLMIVSLYGSKRAPSAEDLAQTDLVIFDIQDVGARFYTYISTLHYVMSACATEGVPVMVLDRPNPNGHYVDGPMREDSFRSFVGMHPVPVVYGMTIGEYAQMIQGEGWLEGGASCDLTVVPCQGYDHQTMYEPPIAPSPNLPNLRAILLYPSLCFFEGTPLSIGRGTNQQFQVIGHPDIPESTYSFTPTSTFGAANPKLKDQLSHGESLASLSPESIFAQGKLDLTYLTTYYDLFPDKSKFFNANGWVDKLAGTTSLRLAIQEGKSIEDIRESWVADLTAFRAIRAKYLLYD